MRLWYIPMVYVAGSVVAGLGFPSIEQLYLPSYTFGLSISSAQACFSAIASGMMALTGIVFAMARSGRSISRGDALSSRIPNMRSDFWLTLSSKPYRPPSTIRRPQFRQSIRSRTFCFAWAGAD